MDGRELHRCTNGWLPIERKHAPWGIPVSPLPLSCDQNDTGSTGDGNSNEKIGKIPDFPAFQRSSPQLVDAVMRFATERTMDLEPIDPETAVELYLADTEAVAAKATVNTHRSRLGHFVEWCDEQDIENLNEMTGRRFHEFRLWRRNVGNINKASEKSQMDTLRVFTRWLESIDGVEQDLQVKVRSPDVSPEIQIPVKLRITTLRANVPQALVRMPSAVGRLPIILPATCRKPLSVIGRMSVRTSWSGTTTSGQSEIKWSSVGNIWRKFRDSWTYVSSDSRAFEILCR